VVPDRCLARKRLEDIPLLANHFLTYFWNRHRQMGDRLPKLSEASVAFLRSRPWRGNVRELQNVIEHVAVLAEPDQIIQPNDIPIYDDSADPGAEGSPLGPMLDEAYHAAKDGLSRTRARVPCAPGQPGRRQCRRPPASPASIDHAAG
jgi:transcriptional regulator with PAS, ATPase and Fis domain